MESLSPPSRPQVVPSFLKAFPPQMVEGAARWASDCTGLLVDRCQDVDAAAAEVAGEDLLGRLSLAAEELQSELSSLQKHMTAPRWERIPYEMEKLDRTFGQMNPFQIVDKIEKDRCAGFFTRLLEPPPTIGAHLRALGDEYRSFRVYIEAVIQSIGFGNKRLWGHYLKIRNHHARVRDLNREIRLRLYGLQLLQDGLDSAAQRCENRKIQNRIQKSAAETAALKERFERVRENTAPIFIGLTMIEKQIESLREQASALLDISRICCENGNHLVVSAWKEQEIGKLMLLEPDLLIDMCAGRNLPAIRGVLAKGGVAVTPLAYLMNLLGSYRRWTRGMDGVKEIQTLLTANVEEALANTDDLIREVSG